MGTMYHCTNSGPKPSETQAQEREGRGEVRVAGWRE
jgi:hypothetical protein